MVGRCDVESSTLIKECHDIAKYKFCSGFTTFFFVIFGVHFYRETILCKNQNSFATVEVVS